MNLTSLILNHLQISQELYFNEWADGKNIFSYGAAGTGKTFVALYLALQDILDENSPFEKLYIVRSLVATREIGFLPGTHEDKASLYQIPYKNMVKHMFEMPDDNSFEMLYENLKHKKQYRFGLLHSFVVLLSTMLLLLLMNAKT